LFYNSSTAAQFYGSTALRQHSSTKLQQNAFTAALQHFDFVLSAMRSQESR